MFIMSWAMSGQDTSLILTYLATHTKENTPVLAGRFLIILVFASCPPSFKKWYKIYMPLHLLTYLLTHSMEQSLSWEANRFWASQDIPLFYGTRRFITAFTSARHLSLSWASSIQSTTPHPTSWRSILILSSHLFICRLNKIIKARSMNVDSYCFVKPA